MLPHHPEQRARMRCPRQQLSLTALGMSAALMLFAYLARCSSAATAEPLAAPAVDGDSCDARRTGGGAGDDSVSAKEACVNDGDHAPQDDVEATTTVTSLLQVGLMNKRRHVIFNDTSGKYAIANVSAANTSKSAGNTSGVTQGRFTSVDTSSSAVQSVDVTRGPFAGINIGRSSFNITDVLRGWFAGSTANMSTLTGHDIRHRWLAGVDSNKSAFNFHDVLRRRLVGDNALATAGKVILLVVFVIFILTFGCLWDGGSEGLDAAFGAIKARRLEQAVQPVMSPSSAPAVARATRTWAPARVPTGVPPPAG